MEFHSQGFMESLTMKTMKQSYSGFERGPRPCFVENTIVASLLLVAMPGAPSSVLAPMAFQSSLLQDHVKAAM